MAPSTRDRASRQRRSSGGDGRARKAAEAQQAAYETSRVVLAAAARRRDAAWRHAARASRRRSAVALLVPAVIAVVLMALGVLSMTFLYAGIAVAGGIGFVSCVMWARSDGVITARLGGTRVTAERRPSFLEATDAARLVDVAAGLLAAFGLPRVDVRVLDDPAPNAISVGRSPDRGVIFVTRGLVGLLDRIELEAVLAHELAHIKRGDTISGAIAVLAFDPLRRYVPAFGWIADRVAGDGRETSADRAAVAVTRYPPGLISALEKLGGAPTLRPTRLSRGVAESTSRMWLAPFGEVGDGPERFGELDLEERIGVLREL